MVIAGGLPAYFAVGTDNTASVTRFSGRSTSVKQAKWWQQEMWSLQGVGALGPLRSRGAMPLEEGQQGMPLALQHSKAATPLGLPHSKEVVLELRSRVEGLVEALEALGQLVAALLRSPLLSPALGACGACADDRQDIWCSAAVTTCCSLPTLCVIGVSATTC